MTLQRRAKSAAGGGAGEAVTETSDHRPLNRVGLEAKLREHTKRLELPGQLLAKCV
jgi:hypothetical protein